MPRMKAARQWATERAALLAACATVEPWVRVTVRGDFACCGTCGHARLQDEDGTFRSYLFWHEQTEERMQEGEAELCLQHGYRPERPERGDEPWEAERHVRAVREVVRQLRAHGFAATWNGDLWECVTITLRRAA